MCCYILLQLVDEFLRGPTAPQTFHMAGLLEQVQHIEHQNAQANHHPGEHNNLCIMYTNYVKCVKMLARGLDYSGESLGGNMGPL